MKEQIPSYHEGINSAPPGLTKDQIEKMVELNKKKLKKVKEQESIKKI